MEGKTRITYFCDSNNQPIFFPDNSIAALLCVNVHTIRGWMNKLSKTENLQGSRCYMGVEGKARIASSIHYQQLPNNQYLQQDDAGLAFKGALAINHIALVNYTIETWLLPHVPRVDIHAIANNFQRVNLPFLCYQYNLVIMMVPCPLPSLFHGMQHLFLYFHLYLPSLHLCVSLSLSPSQVLALLPLFTVSLMPLDLSLQLPLYLSLPPFTMVRRSLLPLHVIRSCQRISQNEASLLSLILSCFSSVSSLSLSLSPLPFSLLICSTVDSVETSGHFGLSFPVSAKRPGVLKPIHPSRPPQQPPRKRRRRVYSEPSDNHAHEPPLNPPGESPSHSPRHSPDPPFPLPLLSPILPSGIPPILTVTGPLPMPSYPSASSAPLTTLESFHMAPAPPLPPFTSSDSLSQSVGSDTSIDLPFVGPHLLSLLDPLDMYSTLSCMPPAPSNNATTINYSHSPATTPPLPVTQQGMPAWISTNPMMTQIADALGWGAIGTSLPLSLLSHSSLTPLSLLSHSSPLSPSPLSPSPLLSLSHTFFP